MQARLRQRRFAVFAVQDRLDRIAASVKGRGNSPRDELMHFSESSNVCTLYANGGESDELAREFSAA